MIGRPPLSNRGVLVLAIALVAIAAACSYSAASLYQFAAGTVQRILGGSP